MADHPACKSCLGELSISTENSWRATILLSDGTTTDITICDDCIASLSENLTKVRRHACEMMAAERALKPDKDEREKNLRDARELRYVNNAWLYVFGARRWSEVAADRLQVAL